MELADVLRVSRQAARKSVTSLETRGHVTLSRDPTDARRTHVALTSSGQRYARTVTQVARALNSELHAAVAEKELANTIKLLTSIVSRWPPVDPPRSPTPAGSAVPVELLRSEGVPKWGGPTWD
jgi:DNA-binding MarR family transcriptional regulator